MKLTCRWLVPAVTASSSWLTRRELPDAPVRSQGAASPWYPSEEES
jgi:hypothetical protein